VRILNTQIASSLRAQQLTLCRRGDDREQKSWAEKKATCIFKERRWYISELYYLRLAFWFLLTACLYGRAQIAPGSTLVCAIFSCSESSKKKLQVRTLRRSLRLDEFDAGMRLFFPARLIWLCGDREATKPLIDHLAD